jgi:hypothetical protein
MGESFLPEIKALIGSFNISQIIEFQNDYNLSIMSKIN